MDEADRMVNLGFEADLTFILDALPSETMEGEDLGSAMDVDGAVVRKGRTRVTTLFSATMPAAVERLARKYLKKAAIITIGEAGRAVDTVEQRVEFVSGDEKKRCMKHVFWLIWRLIIILQAPNAGDSKQRRICLTDNCVCEPEKDGRHGGERFATGQRGCSF